MIGRPLSPYLFVLCMDRLSRWITGKVNEGRWGPLRTSPGRGVKLSHLFFADDILFFAEVCTDQVEVIKEGLQSFYIALGQKVNYCKSLMFSPLILLSR